MPRSRKWGLTVSMTDKRGLHVYFRKKKSKYNVCIGEKMRGVTGKRADIRKKFEAAVGDCK